MFRSVLKRMLILPLLLLIPVNVLVIVASYGNLRAEERERILSQENLIRLVVTQADRDIKETDQDILSWLSSGTELMRLCDYREVNTENTDFYLDMMRAFQAMDTFLQSQNNIQSFFLRIPASQQFWVRGELAGNLAKELPFRFQDMQGYNRKMSYIRKEDEGYYLVSLFQRGGALLGYQLNLDNYGRQLQAGGAQEGAFWIGNKKEYENLLENDRGNIILGVPSETMDMVMAGMYGKDVFRTGTSALVYVLLILSFASVIVAPVLIYYYYRQIFKPTTALRNGMERVRTGEVDYRVPVPDNVRGNEFAGLIVYFNNMLDEVRSARMEAYETRLHQQQLQVNYLSQQIRPHFILNALNAVYANRQEDWPSTKETLLYLSRYFRYIVNAKRPFVRLADEMEFLENYLKLQSQRLGKYFFYIVSWEHDLDEVQIPPLMLSTFVENSIKHALSPENRSCIAVTAEKHETMLRMKVFDGGGGFSEEVLAEIERFRETGEDGDHLGVGIVNVIERLKMIYGDRADIVFYNEGGAMVQVELPVEQVH